MDLQKDLQLNLWLFAYTLLRLSEVHQNLLVLKDQSKLLYQAFHTSLRHGGMVQFLHNMLSKSRPYQK